MKVLLLNPPFHAKFSRASRSPAVANGGTLYYPIWLAYATGALEKDGFECKLIDAPASGKSLEDVKKIAREFGPRMLVLDVSTPSAHNDLKVLEELKREGNFFALLVGTHPSALPEKALEGGEADACARHEYDYVVRDVARAVKEGRDWREVRGVSFKKEDGSFQHNKRMELIKDLDELPMVSEVYKKHLNIGDYFYSANLYPEVTIITGRGCPHQCTFCVWPQVYFDRSYRARSVEKIVEEFEYIANNFPEAKEVFIEDDTFTINKERIREFCKKLVEKGGGLKITWSCNARADVDLETLKWMKKAGCRLMCVGFESGVQEILNNIKKGTRLDVIRQFMKDSKKAGILVHGCFMLGNKGETKETIKKTTEFSKELNPDTAQFFPLMVYPGTQAYEWAKEEGILITDDFSKWLDEEGCHNCMVSRPGLSAEELVLACNNARKEFYFRPGYVASKILQAVTQPKEAKRIFKASKTFFRHVSRDRTK